MSKWFVKLTPKQKKIVKNYGLQKKIDSLLADSQTENLANGQREKISDIRNKLRELFLDKFGSGPQTHTLPTLNNQNSSNTIEHEASTGQIGEEILEYLQSRRLDPEQVKSLVVSGFCADVLALLPMEFAVEARKLVQMTIENGFG